MKKTESALQVINLHAAGIDVGSRSYLVAVDQNKENVREFGVYTKDHEQLIGNYNFSIYWWIRCRTSSKGGCPL